MRVDSSAATVLHLRWLFWGTLAAAAALLVGSLRADTIFYVAPSGSDAWSGRLAAPNAQRTDGPLASIAGARDAIRKLKAGQGELHEPVRVQIRGGTYRLAEPLTLGPQDSGTAPCPVIYEAYPGERPVLSGGQEVSGWQSHREKIQAARLPDVPAGKWYFRSLFAGGRRQTRARFPNVDPSDPYRRGFLYVARDPRGFGYAVGSIHNPGGQGSAREFHYAPGSFKPSWARAPEAEIHIFQSGNCRAFKEIVSIAKVDEPTCSVALRGKECGSVLQPGDRYFVENVPEELDSPGEWYLDRQTGELFYWPPSAAGQVAVVAPRLGRIVQVLGEGPQGKPVRQVRLSGLTFQETDYTPDDGCAGYGMGNDGVVYLKGAEGCAVGDCTFRQIGKYAICLSGGAGNSLVGNDVYDTAEGGVLLLQSARNIVRDNHVHHLGAVYKHVGGVVLEGPGTDDNVVDHNLVHDSSRYGISLKNAGGRNRIECNRILNTNLETYDSGGIEVTQGDKAFISHSLIRGNVVGDTIGYSADGPKPVFLSWGIYLDSYAGGYTVTHNVVYRSAHGGIMLQGGKQNRVENNVFVGGKFNQMHITNFDDNARDLVLERNIFSYADPDAALLTAGRLSSGVLRAEGNLYFHAGGKELAFRGGISSFADWQRRGFDKNALVADPRFVDPKHDDYGLRPDSPARKLGFEPIETHKAGLLHPRCRCEIRPAGPDFGL